MTKLRCHRDLQSQSVDPANLNQDINEHSNIEQPNYVSSGQGWEEVSHNIDFVIKIADCAVLSQRSQKVNWVEMLREISAQIQLLQSIINSGIRALESTNTRSSD